MRNLPPAAPVTRSHPLFAAPAPAQTVAPTVVQTVAVVPTPARTDLLASTENWTWEELRDYVVSEITARFGPFPRDSRKEYGIFTRVMNTYGQDAIAVAKFAFGPNCDGWWGNAPISINRWCKGSDPFFIVPILERLADAESVPST